MDFVVRLFLISITFLNHLKLQYMLARDWSYPLYLKCSNTLFKIAYHIYLKFLYVWNRGCRCLIQTYGTYNLLFFLKRHCQSPPSTPANCLRATSTLQHDGSHYSLSKFPTSPSGISQVYNETCSLSRNQSAVSPGCAFCQQVSGFRSITWHPRNIEQEWEASHGAAQIALPLCMMEKYN